MHTLYHTSPTKIEEIKYLGNDIFNTTLFFSDKIYTMTAADYHVYSIDIADDEILNIDQLHEYYHTQAYKDAINELMEACNIDADDAEEFLEDEKSVDWVCDLETEESGSEAGWLVQRVQSELARKLGFRACKSRDEQGVVYMIDMYKRENELILLNEVA